MGGGEPRTGVLSKYVYFYISLRCSAFSTNKQTGSVRCIFLGALSLMGYQGHAGRPNSATRLVACPSASDREQSRQYDP